MSVSNNTEEGVSTTKLSDCHRSRHWTEERERERENLKRNILDLRTMPHQVVNHLPPNIEVISLAMLNDQDVPEDKYDKTVSNNI
jgi:hypothetical protein